MSVPNICLYKGAQTGSEVAAMICIELNKKAIEPISIQNSRLLVSSSPAICGILRQRPIISAIPQISRIKIAISKCHFIEAPSPVKACTEVSPRIPVRVRKVEYQISTY
ncbi:hypothetical protein FQZ97_1053050 [compost metagenome]